MAWQNTKIRLRRCNTQYINMCANHVAGLCENLCVGVCIFYGEQCIHGNFECFIRFCRSEWFIHIHLFHAVLCVFQCCALNWSLRATCALHGMQKRHNMHATPRYEMCIMSILKQTHLSHHAWCENAGRYIDLQREALTDSRTCAIYMLTACTKLNTRQLLQEEPHAMIMPRMQPFFLKDAILKAAWKTPTMRAQVEPCMAAACCPLPHASGKGHACLQNPNPPGAHFPSPCTSSTRGSAISCFSAAAPSPSRWGS